MERTMVNPMGLNQNLRVFWKPVNLQDCVWENFYRTIIKTTLHEKGTIHYSITLWFTSLFLCAKPWKFLEQRQQWIRNGRKWKRFRRATWRKSEVRQRWSMKQGRTAQKFTSPHRWTFVGGEDCWIWGKAPKIQKVELFSEVIMSKLILDLMQYSRNKDHQDHNWRQQKSWISSRDCLVAMDKQRMQYLLLFKWNGGCSKNNGNSQIGMSGHLGSSTTTNGRNHGPVRKTQSFLLSEICKVILWQDCHGKGNLRRSYWSTFGERFPNWDCFFLHR